MCLILFAHHVHPEYKLIVAANRDEFYKRPTKPADYWEDHPEILAGRDTEAGGTWMGINKRKEVALLTNFRDLKNIRLDAPSRGHLVADFLKNNDRASDYLNKIAQNGVAYNGFNLIAGNYDELFYYGNYQEGVHKISPGIHGLSNALLDTPWPKIDRGLNKLESLIDEDEVNPESLFSILYDNEKAPLEKLPDTGVGEEMEKMLSPMFIKSPEYGSRCSTVLLVDKHDRVTYAERTYDTRNFTYFDKHFKL